MYEYVIVGAGLCGGIIARHLAENGNKILIIERRNHIAGNMYDYTDSHGIKVQKYGPHVLHTNSQEVFDYLTKFCEPVSYRTKCEAVIDGISTPSPFNFKTIDQFYSLEKSKKLKEKLKKIYDNRPSVTIVEMLEAEDKDIRAFAEFLFEKDYKLYTAKQWDLSPDEIDKSVLKRVPIVLSYGDTYFYDTYEFMPKNGFTEMYAKMIEHPNIDLKLNVDALKDIAIDEEEMIIKYKDKVVNLIYTGAIDELFAYKYGELPYRSLFFKFEEKQIDSFQNTAIVAYPQVSDYTRITEYTKMPFQNGNGWTDVAYEYPAIYDPHKEIGKEPYYPVLTDSSKKMYKIYSDYAKKIKNLTLCGRLADFKYYNMDQVVLRAFDVIRGLEEKNDSEV